MGTIKHRKKIVLYSTVLLMSFSSLLNVNASFKVQNEKIAPQDLEQYIVVEDPFDRSFFGGILQRAKIRMNDWFNGEGTIYENTTLDSIIINGYTLSINEIKNNPNQLKELIANRDEEVGLEAIEVTNNTQDKYDYREYLDLLIKNAQPMRIVSDTTWTKESGPYYISGEVQVMKGATLTIEAGTEVYFRSMPSTKYRSGILVDGELILKGTESEKIKLAPYGTDAASGSWKGIYVTERGSLNAEHTIIEKAGGWTESAIYSYGPVTLNKVEIHQTKGSAVTAFSDVIITNSLFKDNENYGIDLYRYNQPFETVVTSNKIEGNKTAGRIIIRQTKIPGYDVSNNTATSTDLNGFVLGGDIIGDMSFTQSGKNLPYVLMNTPGVYGETKPFTIYPKSEVDFKDTVIKVVATSKLAPEHGMVINGTLNLNNSIITSLRDNTVASTTNRTDDVAPSNRDWSGLVVGETGTLNINQSTIKYAKEAVYTHGSVHLNEATIKNVFSGLQGDGKFVIHDSTFTNLEAPAFRYYAGKEPLDISVRNSTFTNINDVLGKVQVYQSGGELDLVNLTATQVKKNGVELTGSFNLDTTISQPGTNLPYLIPQLVINKNAKIDVTGKTVLKVEDGLLMGYKAGIDVYGQLNLSGTSSNRVTVTSLRDDTIGGDSNGDGTLTKPSAGDWGSINYHSSSKNRDSKISYSDIKYGGDQHQGYALGGEGKFNIQYSAVVDSSEAGVGVLGTITIENSSLERNHGYGVHVRSSNNFSVTMNDNHFKDNLNYAAFVEFGSTLDHIEVSGNEASNNKVNGVGITGTVRYDLGLLPAGDKFPYVVPNTLVIEEGSSLTLNPKTVVKFDQNAKLDVEGHLKTNGTSDNKVYFTSLMDDSIAGDTNNDAQNSEAQDEDWTGIIYHADSEGTFNHFECSYSIYNMDYNNIPHIRVLRQDDGNISLSSYSTVFIDKINDKYRLIEYNSKNNQSTVITTTLNRVSQPIIQDNLILWIEADNKINLYNKLTGKIKTLVEMEIKNYFYNDNYLTFIDGNNSLYVKNIDTNNTFDKIENVSSDFIPIVSSDVVIYKSIEDGMIHKRSLKEYSEDFILLTNKTNHITADIWGNNLALLSNEGLGDASNIIVGNIDSWKALNVTNNVQYNNELVTLYKNQIAYFNKNIAKEILIRESDDKDNIYEISKLSRGYDVKDIELDKETVSFSTYGLVYILDTKFNSSKEVFVEGELSESFEYERSTIIGDEGGFQIGLGGDWGDAVSGKLGYQNGNTTNLGYLTQRDAYNNLTSIGINREQIAAHGIFASAGIEIGKKLEFGISGDVGTAVLNQEFDEYYFSNSLQGDTLSDEASRLLATLAAPRFIEVKNGSITPHDKAILDIIEANLDNIGWDENNIIQYDLSSGKGVNFEASAEASLGAILLAGALSGGVNSQSIVEKGTEKLFNNQEIDYVQQTTAYKTNFGGELGFDFLDDLLDKSQLTEPITFNINLKIPTSISLLDSESKLLVNTRINENKELHLILMDGSRNEHGYLKTYIYKINGEDFDNAVQSLPWISELYNNLNNYEGDYVLSNDINIHKKIDQLLEFISEAKEIKYQIILTNERTDDHGFNFEFTKGIHLGVNYLSTDTEQVSIVVEDGILTEGEVKSNIVSMAFIPSEDEKTKSIIEQSVKLFVETLSPALIPLDSSWHAKYNNDSLGIDAYIPSPDSTVNIAFIEVPFLESELSDGKFYIDDEKKNALLYGHSTYIEAVDIYDNTMDYFPAASTLTYDLENVWDSNLSDYYAVYTLNSDDKWEKIGGKIDKDNKKLTIDMPPSGRYAVGVDMSILDIKFYSEDNNLLYDGYTLSPGEMVTVEINHTMLNENTIQMHITDNSDKIISKNCNISCIIPDMEGEYTLTVKYKDNFKNEFEKSISIKVNNSERNFTSLKDTYKETMDLTDEQIELNEDLDDIILGIDLTESE